MKKIIMASLLMLLTPLIHAWECPRNPDRFPSLGLNISTAKLTGDKNYVNNPGLPNPQPFKDSGHQDFDSVGADVRLPVTDGLTFSVSYDQISANGDYTRDQNIFKQSDNFDGYRVGVGVRMYFNK